MDRGAWRDIVHGVAKSRTRLATKHSGRKEEQGLAPDPEPRDSPRCPPEVSPSLRLFSGCICREEGGRPAAHPGVSARLPPALLGLSWRWSGEAPLGPVPWRAVPLSGDNGALKDRGVSSSL